MKKKGRKVNKFHTIREESLPCKQGLVFLVCPKQLYRTETVISYHTELGFSKMFGLLNQQLISITCLILS